MPPNRRPRRSPGALPLIIERDLYISLMRQGVSNATACRIVGVNRKTGHRWRYGPSIAIRAGEIRTYPAITFPVQEVSETNLAMARPSTVGRVGLASGSARLGRSEGEPRVDAPRSLAPLVAGQSSRGASTRSFHRVATRLLCPAPRRGTSVAASTPCVDLGEHLLHHGPAQLRRPGRDRDPAATQCRGLLRLPVPALTLVQHRQHRGEHLTQCHLGELHPPCLQHRPEIISAQAVTVERPVAPGRDRDHVPECPKVVRRERSSASVGPHVIAGVTAPPRWQ